MRRTVLRDRGEEEEFRRDAAARSLRLSLRFGWAAKNKLIGASPCADIDKPAEETERDRVLTEDEIRRFWSATETDGGAFRDVFRLQLITAQRREEVLGMRWSEVNLETRTWTIPARRTKNSKRHEVALSDLAVETLKERPRDQALVFPSVRPRRGNEGKTAISGYSKANKRVVTAMGVDDHVRFHDLRRTTTTLMAKMKIPPHVVDRGVLNHTSGIIKGVAAIYNRYEYGEEAREALMKWGDRLHAIVGAAENVEDAPRPAAVAE